MDCGNASWLRRGDWLAERRSRSAAGPSVGTSRSLKLLEPRFLICEVGVHENLMKKDR